MVFKDIPLPSIELLETKVKATPPPSTELLETLVIKVKVILPPPNTELLEIKVKAIPLLPNMEPLANKVIPLLPSTALLEITATRATPPPLNNILLPRVRFKLRPLPRQSPGLTHPNTDLIIYLFIILRNFNFN